VALAGSTVASTTMQYDEFTDLLIASSLAQHPLTGSIQDPSQARLPMYITAAASLITEPSAPVRAPEDVLHLSRWLSIFATVLAIWGTYILGAALFDRRTGLVGASLFAFSPYVLHFGRDAMTQGDAFTAAAVVFAVVSFVWFDRERSTSALVALSLSLAIAISSKFYLVVLVVAFIAYHGIVERAGSLRRLEEPAAAESAPVWSFMARAMLAGALSLLALLVSLHRTGQPPDSRRLLAWTGLGMLLFALLCVVSCVWTAIRVIRSRPAESAAGSLRWPLAAAWSAILPLTLAGTLVLFPAHTLNQSIVPSLLERATTMDGTGRLFTQAGEAVRLHLAILLFKLGLPLGILTCAAMVWAGYGARANRGVLLIVLILALYVLLLAALPLQQPFWLMSVYPLIVSMLGAFIVHMLRAARGTRWRPALLFALTGAFIWLAMSLVRVYPVFGYYGYETIGTRWLGADSRGYRAPIVVTNDGSTEALLWLQLHAPVGSVVLSYLNDIHVVSHLETREAFRFELRHVLRFAGRRASQEDLVTSDYAVVRLVDDFGPPSPLTDPAFIRQFGIEPVHEIYRGRGIYRMPVMRIYQNTGI
jgi:hypothetical protein